MSRDEIIEKIKKLLRMKRGGTPAEVETALALAAELARKHGIDLDGVDPDHMADQPIGHIDATTAAKIGWECKYAGLICEGFFNVTSLLLQTKRGRRYQYFRSYNVVPEFKMLSGLTDAGRAAPMLTGGNGV